MVMLYVINMLLAAAPAEHSHAWVVVQRHARAWRQLKDANGHGGVIMDVQIRHSAPARCKSRTG
jgi:hypothetical protein